MTHVGCLLIELAGIIVFLLCVVLLGSRNELLRGGFGVTCMMSLLWSEMIVMSWCFEKKREKKLDGCVENNALSSFHRNRGESKRGFEQEDWHFSCVVRWSEWVN